jgi:thiamine-monophosphate kinase
MKTNDLKIEELGEFEFIRSIKDDCHFSHEKLIKGIGDDCAVVGPYEGKALLLTTDTLLEDIHFLLAKIPPEHLGEKSVAVNLSDIAAMGGKALHLLVSLAIPRTMSVDTVHAMYRGMKRICRRYGVNILGGDTVASPHRLMINVTVLGEAPEKEVLYRSGARPGDYIYLTGTIGDSAAGLRLIRGEFSAPEQVAFPLREAHNRPVPHLEAGRIIARSGLASAMIDLSDGLLSDLRHICEASSVGARLIYNALPLSGELKALAEANNFDPYKLALAGGEDYRLLITVPRQNAEAFNNIFSGGIPCPAFQVGQITEHLGMRITRPDGSEEMLEPRGYNHFIAHDPETSHS